MPDQPRFVDIWEWPRAFHERAVRANDTMRQKLWPSYREAWGVAESNPAECLTRYKGGRMLAQSLEEPLWEIFFDYWIADFLLGYQRDIQAGLDVIVRAAVRARAPEFRTWPFNPRVQFTLINAYRLYDPLSFRDEVLGGIAHLESELNYDADVWRLVSSIEHSVYRAEDNPEVALNCLYRYLERSQGDAFRLCGGYDELCSLYMAMGRYKELQETAQLGESYARKERNRKHTLINLQIWQAVGAAKSGDRELAQRLYRVALGTINSLGNAFQRDRADALPIYYEVTEQLESAQEYYRNCVAAEQQSGSPYEEYAARLALCRMLKIMGQLTEPEIEATRAAMNRLKFPLRYPLRLDRIIQGDIAHLL
jgi:hypothetical protein